MQLGVECGFVGLNCLGFQTSRWLKRAECIWPDTPCIEYMPTFGWFSEVNVGKYSIHGVFETMYAYIGVVLGVNVGI